MNLVWLVGGMSVPCELRALLIFSNHSFLSLEQSPTHMCWSNSEEYLGSLRRLPGFSHCAALSSPVLCPLNCNHLGLPGYLAPISWTQSTKPCLDFPSLHWRPRTLSGRWAVIGPTLFPISLQSLPSLPDVIIFKTFFTSSGCVLVFFFFSFLGRNQSNLCSFISAGSKVLFANSNIK